MASRIVTITCSAPAVVISERIADRERFDNGSDLLEPNVPQDFIVHEGQSVRVVALPEPEPVADAKSELLDQHFGAADQPATSKDAE